MIHIIKKVIVSAAVAFLCLFANAQTTKVATTKVSGTILDSEGEPIIGAVVWIKRTDFSAISDLDGKYSLQFQGDFNTLSCSALSYKENSIQVKTGQNQIVDIVLENEFDVLQEVVVVGMNNRQTKRSITGAISTIQTKDLVQSPVGNVSNALAGKVPGLITVQTSGEPGSDAAALYVRGTGTYGTSTPLIVIDGFPRTKSDLDGIDANEIESITVLKDASSSSLYGIQGANGVIVVTTKRGNGTGDSAPRISFTMQQAMQQPIRLPQVLDVYNQALYYKTLDSNDGRSVRYTDEIMEKLQTGSDPVLYPSTDWFDVVLKNRAHQQQYNVNVSGTVGKDNRVNYFVSGSYFNQGTLLNHEDEFQENYGVKSKFDRFNFRSNVDFQATKRLSIRADFSARLQSKIGPYTGFSSIFGQITGRRPSSSAVFNPDGTIAASSALEEFAEPGNPYGLLTRSGYYRDNYNTFSGTVLAKYDFDSWIKGLSLQASYNFEMTSDVYRQWLQRFDSYTYLGQVNGVDAYSQATESTRLSSSTSTNPNHYYYYDVRLNYERQLSDHYFSVQAIANRTLKDYLGSLYKYAYQGVSTRATYDYAKRYFAEFNLGFNGSENFHPDRRYGVFPAGSLGWVLSDEKWFNCPDWIKIIKLRTSYGVVGNDQIGGTRFMYISDFGPGGGPSYSGGTKFWAGYYFGLNASGYDSSAAQGYNETLVGNEYVTWETARKLNSGIDISLFKDNALSLSLDYFREMRTDILTAAGKVPDYVGIKELSPRNSGEVLNQGAEFEIRFTKRFNSSFSAYANLQGTYARNKVLENDRPTPAYDYQDLRGYEIGYELGYHVLGYFKDQDDIDNSPKQTWDKVIPGDIKYQDTNDDGVIDENDRVPIKCNSVPIFSGGLSFGFNWRGFDFGTVISGAVGGTARMYVYHSSILNLQRWTPENTDALLPVAHTSGNNAQTSDYNIMSTDYIKIRNIELGYTVPAKVMNKIRVESLRVYMNIQNVATWDKMWLKDRDPEAAGGGTLPYPIQRIFNFGVRFDL